jgi:Predicted membrane protein (DUF2254)
MEYDATVRRTSAHDQHRHADHAPAEPFALKPVVPPGTLCGRRDPFVCDARAGPRVRLRGAAPKPGRWARGGLSILETVATSTVSLAALVLTITMVVVQLAMAQFSPRIVQRVLQDKPSQLAIGAVRSDVRSRLPRDPGSQYRLRGRRRQGARGGSPHRVRPGHCEHRCPRHLRPSHRPIASSLRAH